MILDDFDFPLPAECIAQRPAAPRDAARLLRVAADRLSDHHVRDLPDLLRPGDLLVVNDTRVIPSRLRARRAADSGSGAIEATLVEGLSEGCWRALVRPARRLRPGDRLDFPGALAATVADKATDGSVVLDFACDRATLDAALDAHGAAPLPPYIRRTAPDARDRADYQTVFAVRPGAIAAPTAGLHFTPALLAGLDRAGVQRTTVTLHVGIGTFAPVRALHPDQHVLHPERGELGVEAARAIDTARSAGRRIVAVGTTALRVLETAADESGRVRPWRGETALFIRPGHVFRTADLLLTNFHLPRSTLFMLVAAFTGLARMRAAYAHAVATGYRFYSYGDATLLLREGADRG